MTSVVFDASSGLLASKPCGPAHAWEQTPLVSPATRVSHLHVTGQPSSSGGPVSCPWDVPCWGIPAWATGPVMCAALGAVREPNPLLSGSLSPSAGSLPDAQRSRYCGPAFEKRKLIAKLIGKEAGGRAQICLCDPGFWDKR